MGAHGGGSDLSRCRTNVWTRRDPRLPVAGYYSSASALLSSLGDLHALVLLAVISVTRVLKKGSSVFPWKCPVSL